MTPDQAPTKADTNLLVSDVDDTLTGDDAGLTNLVDLVNRNRARVLVALNSSRPYESVKKNVTGRIP